MKKKIIVGNWKMNPTSYEEAKRIYRAVKKVSMKLLHVNTVICPPFVYSKSFIGKEIYGNFLVGAQNVFSAESGAFTGEISPVMLKDLGITHVIVGHSERRALGETDEMTAKKVQVLLEVGISPILCVGEKERTEQGEYLGFLKAQIKNSLDKVSSKNIKNLIIAYEPIWAIGAKEAMTPENIFEMGLFIKKTLSDMYGHDDAVSTQVLYGGAVNFRNAGDIITQGQVDGLLVGRESLNISGFTELLKAVESL